MKTSGIYKIINIITGDFYIGSSKDIKNRWISHKCPSTWKKIPNLCIPQTVIENRNLNIDLDKIVVTRGKGEVLYLFERDKENKLIEPYSIKNYFPRVLLNYDKSKIKFLTKK